MILMQSRVKGKLVTWLLGELSSNVPLLLGDFDIHLHIPVDNLKEESTQHQDFFEYQRRRMPHHVLAHSRLHRFCVRLYLVIFALDLTHS